MFWNRRALRAFFLKTMLRRRLPLLLLSLVPIFASRAQSPDPEDPESRKFGHGFLDRIANTPLPFTSPDSAIEIDIQPKLGDFIDHPYVRLPVEATYGFTEDLEGSVGLIPYFENPFDSEPVSSDGYVTLGLKQRIHDLYDERFDLAVGIDAKIPLEEIPSSRLRDSYDSYMPYVTASYALDDAREWLAFATLQYRMVGPDRREVATEDPDPYSLGVLRPGVIYQPGGNFRYSMQFEYKTERLDSGKDDGLKLIPAITWFPPPDTPFFRSIAGHFEFTLELDYAISEIKEEEGGSEVGASVDVRWRLYPKRSTAEDTVF